MTDAEDTAEAWADRGLYVPDEEGMADGALSSTLMRGLAVLGCFTVTDGSLSNSEIARRINLGRPTVSRLCKTLVHLGYLRKDDRGAFRLAPGLLALTHPVLAATPWRHRVAGPMREIADMYDGNVALAVLSEDRFVHIQTAGDPLNFPHVPEMGITGPLHRSAGGRALLSLLSSQALYDKLAELRARHPEEFARHAAHTRASIERCWREGFCVSYGEWHHNIFVASAPLGRSEDGLLVALTCALPRYRTRAEMVEADLGPRLAGLADSLRMTGLFHAPEIGRPLSSQTAE
ncbi:helix-turn-helix domain-containing protein [Roseobacter sp. HKCCD9010]|uniref:IclR family transcriptional regulator n=1 Tax=unclassified Roseobacter TaxID=196798 RepID=UPI001492FB4C|nr:helix-turn-helix domain-containing protein [Rhodobacterales bacterium HKCCD4356]NNV14252.1 helix-turn-helix domain-containing protein [Roseobacter sp. HKCCD7357]NNV18445.1 helix-turn-helix domain-containing protein [Roseobacter sp. HKCCD8768]NNV27885.1 helix-turn-helix domain-containing protein [Roseobacter sp. HKCCD8192]NNV32177.1 helix-turn-helix domain-containing protein [Roseobacter sp. HKCCD9061]NNV36409.1 helix-turn-helix domain-containing protein [Roseobacter sp. HKCCD9073]NNV40695.